MNQPNILLITTDQQRFDTCGPAAPSFMRTPHYDHLANEGITFSRAYADCPICVASRTSIMTGKYVFTHGNAGNGYSSKYYDTEGTLPTCMAELGYQTAAIGKMHFMPQRKRHGFQEMVLPADYYIQMRESGLPYQPMRHGLGQNELYAGMATVPESLTLTSWTAEQCVRYIRDRRDPTMPFFLWCSFSKPHPPLDPPEPYYSMYRNCDIPEPVVGKWATGDECPIEFKRHRQAWSTDKLTPEVIREARAAYYGLITQIDYNMGRLFAALQDLDLFSDTLIIYTSDHGEYLGDHHCGSKIFFHEPSSHVPFVMRLPKNWDDRPNAVTNDHLITLADILPTCVGAAGGTSPDDVDGLDLIALARGQAEPRTHVYATSNGRPYVAMTDGRWKYTWWPEGPSEQLFDLQSDPHEQHDLARQSAHKDQREHMQRTMINWLSEQNSDWVSDGELRIDPVQDDTEAERRNTFWPGYHTDSYEVDIRH